MRGTLLTPVLAGLAASVLGAKAPAQNVTPKRGGVLNFAVVAEPPNYDCHANTTFGVLHPVGPHYSTLLKYTGDWKKHAHRARRRLVLVRFTRWAYLHVQAAAGCEVP